MIIIAYLLLRMLWPSVGKLLIDFLHGLLHGSVRPRWSHLQKMRSHLPWCPQLLQRSARAEGGDCFEAVLNLLYHSSSPSSWAGASGIITCFEALLECLYPHSRQASAPGVLWTFCTWNHCAACRSCATPPGTVTPQRKKCFFSCLLALSICESYKRNSKNGGPKTIPSYVDVFGSKQCRRRSHEWHSAGIIFYACTDLHQIWWVILTFI